MLVAGLLLAVRALALVLASLLAVVVVLAWLARFRLRAAAPARRTAFLRRTLGSIASHAEHPRIVAFFHPYCNAGGGGERVLWTALACMQRSMSDLKQPILFVVYTGDLGPGGASKDDILNQVKARFGISLSASSLAFVPLRRRHLVEDSTYSRFTLLGQSLGSVVLALEGITGREGVAPDVWMDTMGYAFAYPLVKWLLGIPVGSYTHYPTISTDMLSRVRSRTPGHTNPSAIASSAILSRAKLLYYTAFARAYAWSLGKADTVMVNSTWTRQHVEQLLSREAAEEKVDLEGTGVVDVSDTVAAPANRPDPLRRRGRPATAPRSPGSHVGPEASGCRHVPPVQTVYPPCDTAALTTFPCTTTSRVPHPDAPITILSLAQFRPEKEHATQLRAFAELLRGPHHDHLPPSVNPRRLRLVLAGSARHAADFARVEALRELAVRLEIEQQVRFVVNAGYGDVCDLMRTASVGLHTMIDEHFGITVVEFQAAGLLTLAHASAGPLLDILVPFTPSISSVRVGPGPTGFLAAPPTTPTTPTTSEDPAAHAFAAQLAQILSLPEAEQDAIRSRARASAVARFGVDAFESGWMRAWARLEAVAAASSNPPGPAERQQ